jgi:protein-S-isoprenylcysteine O-methyltransferase Ste14
VVLALAIVLMLTLHATIPIRRVVVGPWRWTGLALLGGGVAVVLRVAAMFRRAGTTIRPFETSSALVERGPFRLSRNPIYLGMVVFLLGVALLAGSLSPFLVIPVFAWILDRRFIRAEEAVLAKTFGPAYDTYRGRVRRWI